VSEWELRELQELEERRAEVGGLGTEGDLNAGGGPLFLPTPPFMVSAGDEE